MKQQAASQEVSVRTILQDHTNDAHMRLHQHAYFLALFDGKLELAGYKQLMRRFYGFYAPLDRAIANALAETTRRDTSYAYVKRSDILARDLSDLKFSDQEISDSPSCDQALDIVSPRSVGGVLYVVEGATLGGALIDRAARRILCETHPGGRHYWAWCRSVNKQRWPAAKQYLNDLSAQGAPTADLVSGARDTFELLAEWLAPLDQSSPLTDRGRF